MTESLFGIVLPDRLLWFVAVLIAVFFLCALALIAAVVLLRVRNILKRRRWTRMELSWEPVIPDVLVYERPESDLHDLVKPSDQRYFVDFLLRYSSRLKGEERSTVLQLARPYMPAIARQLNRRSAERRARALKTLGELDADTYAAQTIEALRDPSPLVAITAARALARHRSPEMVHDLVQGMETFELWHTRFLAAILAELGPDVAPALRGFLQDPQHSARTRALAAATLEQLNDLNAVDAAVTVVETERDVDLLVAAVRLIRKVGSGDHVAAVRRLLEAPSPAVRGYAVATLASIGTPGDTSLIQQAIDDESNWVVMHAVRGLKAVGRLDILRELAESDHPRAPAALEVLAGASP